MVAFVVSLVACGLPLSSISAKRFTFSNAASSLNSRKIIYNYRFSPRNLMPDSATRLRKSRWAVIFSRRLKWKRNSRICPCGFCIFHLNSPQMDEKSVLAVLEAVSEEELLAAANLRVRTFYEFNQRYRAEEHRRYMLKLEFEALKDRTTGKRLGFKRVACVIATIPIDEVVNCMDDLYSSCKVMLNGEKRVVVGTLDVNQSIQLPDEISGTRPKGIEAGFARAYVTNVCVATELHRKGIGTALIMQALKIAQKWGDSQDCRSTMGYLFSLGSTPISPVSKKMQARSLSITEVEYHALVKTAKEDLQVVDILTKPLPKVPFQKLRDMIPLGEVFIKGGCA